MTGYVRKDTTNNIADGNVINAADLDSEFDGVQDGFNASTGHTHGGAAGEGAPITRLGPTQDVTASAVLLAPKTTNTVDIGSSGLKFKDLFLAGNASVGGTLAVTGTTTLSAALTYGGVTLSNAVTGTGNMVLSTSPTLVTPILGTPTSATLTNATGLPIATGVSGLGTGVATALAVNVGSAGAPVVNGGALGTPSSGTVTNLTGTASININGTVGATTPTTGAFTTLAASSSVTLSGGTANGVTYLNGSKVLTSGSALTFDGTNLLVGTASSIFTTTVLQATSATTQVAGLQQTGGASNSALTTWNTGTTGPIYQHKFAYGAGGSLAGSITTDSSGNTSYNSAGAVVFGYSGTTEGMRLTSTGLGIGTSSPSSFDSSWNKLVLGGGSGDVGQTIYSGSASIGTIAFADGTTGAQQYAGLIRYLHSSNSMTFWTNAGIKATLDSAGNLGLGVTPSAWNTIKPIEIARAGSFVGANSSGSTYLGANTRFASGWIYANTAAAGLYTVEDNTHFWRSAPSGTAGDTITWTQAMTLTAAGNLGVGTTSPSGKLHVAGGASNVNFYLSNNSYSSYYYQNTGGSSGVSFPASQAYIWDSGGSERARIDSSGNLLVGTTSSYGSRRFEVRGGVDGFYLSTLANTLTSGVPSGLQIYYPSLSPNGTGSQFISCADSTTARFDVRSNGGIANYSANDVNLSDRREKTNFAPAGEYLSKICAIPVQTFNYIDQNLEEDGGLTLGVVAQDVQAVAPELVMESNWGTEENPKMRLSIYQTDLQYALMKALQEAVAEINSLKARLDAANL